MYYRLYTMCIFAPQIFKMSHQVDYKQFWCYFEPCPESINYSCSPRPPRKLMLQWNNYFDSFRTHIHQVFCIEALPPWLRLAVAWYYKIWRTMLWRKINNRSSWTRRNLHWLLRLGEGHRLQAWWLPVNSSKNHPVVQVSALWVLQVNMFYYASPFLFLPRPPVS